MSLLILIAPALAGTGAAQEPWWVVPVLIGVFSLVLFLLWVASAFAKYGPMMRRARIQRERGEK